MPPSTFAPWSMPIRADDRQMKSVVYDVSHIIYHFPSRQGIERFVRSVRLKSASTATSPCNRLWKDGMMPPSCCPLLSMMRVVWQCIAYRVWVEGERIDAETCDGIAAGED